MGSMGCQHRRETQSESEGCREEEVRGEDALRWRLVGEDVMGAGVCPRRDRNRGACREAITTRIRFRAKVG